MPNHWTEEPALKCLAVTEEEYARRVAEAERLRKSEALADELIREEEAATRAAAEKAERQAAAKAEKKARQKAERQAAREAAQREAEEKERKEAEAKAEREAAAAARRAAARRELEEQATPPTRRRRGGRGEARRRRRRRSARRGRSGGGGGGEAATKRSARPRLIRRARRDARGSGGGGAARGRGAAARPTEAAAAARSAEAKRRRGRREAEAAARGGGVRARAQMEEAATRRREAEEAEAPLTAVAYELLELLSSPKKTRRSRRQNSCDHRSEPSRPEFIECVRLAPAAASELVGRAYGSSSGARRRCTSDTTSRRIRSTSVSQKIPHKSCTSSAVGGGGFRHPEPAEGGAADRRRLPGIRSSARALTSSGGTAAQLLRGRMCGEPPGGAPPACLRAARRREGLFTRAEYQLGIKLRQSRRTYGEAASSLAAQFFRVENLSEDGPTNVHRPHVYPSTSGRRASDRSASSRQRAVGGVVVGVAAAADASDGSAKRAAREWRHHARGEALPPALRGVQQRCGEGRNAGSWRRAVLVRVRRPVRRSVARPRRRDRLSRRGVVVVGTTDHELARPRYRRRARHRRRPRHGEHTARGAPSARPRGARRHLGAGGGARGGGGGAARGGGGGGAARGGGAPQRGPRGAGAPRRARATAQERGGRRRRRRRRGTTAAARRRRSGRLRAGPRGARRPRRPRRGRGGARGGAAAPVAPDAAAAAAAPPPAEASRGLCVICDEQAATWALLDCGHKVLCETCVRFFEAGPNGEPPRQTACPMCREPVARTLRIWD